MRTSIRMAAVAVLLGAAGCARTHMTSAFGTANHEAFLAQRVRPPDAPAPQPNMALDTQESGVISESYLRSLSGKNERTEREPVLYVAPQQPGAPAQRLAPSVPHE
jgi:hypothetical protein